MKKSEMVELMWKFIQSVENDYDVYMGKDNTEQLLDKMLEAGMLPPDNNTGWRLTENGEMLYATHEWDKE